MNYYQLGAGLSLGAAIALAFWYLHRRLRAVESQLIQEKQKNVDQKIVEKNSKLTDSELDALLGVSVGRHTKT